MLAAKGAALPTSMRLMRFTPMPLSSKYGAYKTVNARLWSRLSG